MGWFGVSGKRLHLSDGELRDLLDSVSGLDNEEEEAVFRKLQKYRSGGLSRSEIENVVRDLKYDRKDPVSRQEAERVQKALLDALVKED